MSFGKDDLSFYGHQYVLGKWGTLDFKHVTPWLSAPLENPEF